MALISDMRWEIYRIATPCCFKFSKSLKRRLASLAEREEVGSSSISNFGLRVIALAIAIICLSAKPRSLTIAVISKSKSIVDATFLASPRNFSFLTKNPALLSASRSIIRFEATSRSGITPLLIV